MRKSIASYAIIKHSFAGIDKYLLQYNKGWQAYNFISGHVDEIDRDDFEKTIIRELEEELPGIKYQKDFIVSPFSDKPFQSISYSLKAKKETEYIFYLFFVKFLVPFDQLCFLWEKQGINKWFSEYELKSGKGIDGSVITSFPVPQIIDWVPGRLNSLSESF